MGAPAASGPDLGFSSTRAFMDTTVTVRIVAPPEDPRATAAAAEAFAWFAEVEARCSRFDPGSELRALAEHPGEPFPASPVLFEAMRFACAVAEQTGGAFDPAIGARQQARGLDRNYRTGRAEPWTDPSPAPAEEATWRDIALDPNSRTITLKRPLLPDLGAVAKGMAVDLAARAIAGAFSDFVVDAGGDLFASGMSPSGEPWRVGLRHPRLPGAVAAVLQVAGAAVCSSGDYLREAAGGHHILDPLHGQAATEAIACTVVAPSAMMADALATAAFVLGPRAGVSWLQAQGVEGMLTAPDLSQHATAGFARLRA
jgi:thiamine biosynthesis lipoprotein